MPLGWHSSVHYCRHLSAFTINAPADHTWRSNCARARVWDHPLWGTQRTAGPSTHLPPAEGGTGLDQGWQSQDSTFPGSKTGTSFATRLSSTPALPLRSRQCLRSHQPCPSLPFCNDGHNLSYSGQRKSHSAHVSRVPEICLGWPSKRNSSFI